jgi:hypothetical protein
VNVTDRLSSLSVLYEEMKPNRASGCPRLLSRRGEDKAGLQFGGEVSVQVGTWGKAVGLNMSTILRKCNTKFRLLHSVQGEKNVLLETELKKRICHIVSDCTSSQVLLFDLTSHNPNHLKKNPPSPTLHPSSLSDTHAPLPDIVYLSPPHSALSLYLNLLSSCITGSPHNPRNTLYAVPASTRISPSACFSTASQHVALARLAEQLAAIRVGSAN